MEDKRMTAEEARFKSKGFKRNYFDACYKRIDGAARRGKEYVILPHAPEADLEDELITQLRADGYKVLENAKLVTWYGKVDNYVTSTKPIYKPKPEKSHKSICDATDARIELNAHRVNYIANQYQKIWDAAQEGWEWCQLDRSADKQLEGLLCELLKQDGYEVHADKMIVTWL